MEKSLIYSLEEIDKAESLLFQVMEKYPIFTFSGPLGAGKTTLVKRILKRAGVADTITSPTYTYVSMYTNRNDKKFYHFDLYRIGGVNEFVDLGFNEYLFEANSWSFIEWPEVINPLLKHKVCEVKIDYYGTDQRILYYTLLD